MIPPCAPLDGRPDIAEATTDSSPAFDLARRSELYKHILQMLDLTTVFDLLPKEGDLAKGLLPRHRKRIGGGFNSRSPFLRPKQHT
jgi:hypothetical protein